VPTSLSERTPERQADGLPDWSTIEQPAGGAGKPALGGIVVRAVGIAAVAAFLLWRGQRVPAIVLLVVGALATGASLVFPVVAKRLDQATVWLQRWAGRALGIVFLGFVQLVIFTPISLVLRLVGKNPMTLRSPREANTFWRPFPVRTGRPLYRRPFTYEGEAGGADVGRRELFVRRLCIGLGALVLLFVLDVGLGAVINRVKPIGTANMLANPNAAAGQAEPWRNDLGREITRVEAGWRYDPYLGWKMSDYDGAYVKVVGGVRRSYEPPGSNARNAVRVFFFGGSALFGYFQRDEHTIPSEFARLAQADGIRVRVVNYGVGAYTNWQEALKLEQLVTAGTAPDLAVFYDGYNEVLSQFQVGLHTQPSNIQANEFADRLGLGHHGDASSAVTAVYDFWSRHSALERVLHVLGRGGASTGAVPITGDQEHRPQDRGRDAASIYARGVQVASRLAGSYGFRSGFFFQPTIFTKRLVPGEEPIVGQSGAKPGPWRHAIDVARSRVGQPVTDLSTALNGTKAPLMYDDVHTNELGAKLMAQALYARLRPSLLEAARGKRP
jgi:lysophospholipase L1-like esterase